MINLLFLIVWVIIKVMGEDLQNDIIRIAQNNEAIFQRFAPFGGALHKIVGELKDKTIVTIWLLTEESETFRFVTLYPDKL